MGISWLTVLKVVPWNDVISNAPKVVDGARSLWGAVAKKTAPAAPAAPVAGGDAMVASPDVDSNADEKTKAFAALEARVVSLGAAVTDLQAQMLKSSELIKQLAEQNTQLIKRIEVNRIRTQRLAICVIVAVGLLVAQRF